MGGPMYRVRWTSQGWTGGPGLNTFYFRPSGEFATQADATECAARVRAFYTDLAQVTLGILPSSWSGQLEPEVSVLDWEDGTLLEVLSSNDATTLAGSAGSAFGPASIMGVLQLTTGGVVHGRSVRGRAFIGPVNSVVAANLSPPSGVRTNIQTSADSNLDVTIAEDVTHVVWSRPFDGAPGNPARNGSMHDVIQYASPAYWGGLRSRRDG